MSRPDHEGPGTLTLGQLLVDIWSKTLAEGVSEVEVGGVRHRVGRTHNQGLRVVAFTYQDWSIEGIEQNPQTSSRWAKLAQQGSRIMQFSRNGRYFANVCEGRLTRYPAWKSQGLPD
jgi:hypothetical protein